MAIPRAGDAPVDLPEDPFELSAASEVCRGRPGGWARCVRAPRAQAAAPIPGPRPRCGASSKGPGARGNRGAGAGGQTGSERPEITDSPSNPSPPGSARPAFPGPGGPRGSPRGSRRPSLAVDLRAQPRPGPGGRVAARAPWGMRAARGARAEGLLPWAGRAWGTLPRRCWRPQLRPASPRPRPAPAPLGRRPRRVGAPRAPPAGTNRPPALLLFVLQVALSPQELEEVGSWRG